MGKKPIGFVSCRLNIFLKVVKILINFNVSDGISLNYIEDKKFKTTTLFVSIHTPLKRETATLNALLPLVLKRGSKCVPTFDMLERKMAELFGANLNCNVIKRGENQILYFELSVIGDAFSPDRCQILNEASKLLLDIIFNPYTEDGGFSKEYTKSEKSNLYDMISATVNDKQNYALWRLYETMCAGEAFGIHELGVLTDIEKIDEKMLYEHYKKVITESVIDIFVCGNADIYSFKAELEEQLKGIERKGKFSYPKTSMHKKRKEVLKTVEEFEANQAKLSLGFTTEISPDDEAYYSLLVANSIFGSGVHSKLFNNVREKLSLAYYAFSRLTRRKGIMLVGMGIQETNYQKAFDETLLQLDLLKKGEISDDEFGGAVMYLINNARSAADSQMGMIMFYLDNKIDGVCISIEDYCRKIESVTKESVIEAISKTELDSIYFLKGKTSGEESKND